MWNKWQIKEYVIFFSRNKVNQTVVLRRVNLLHAYFQKTDCVLMLSFTVMTQELIQICLQCILC